MTPAPSKGANLQNEKEVKSSLRGNEKKKQLP